MMSGGSYSSMLLFICTLQFFSIIYLIIYVHDISKQQNSDIMNIKSKPNNHPKLKRNISSSVFCYGKTRKERQCRFFNLCYSRSKLEYLFLHGKKTMVYGIPVPRKESPMLDLSSVDDHSAMYFEYTDVFSEEFDLSSATFIDGPSLLLKRFNPDNLMHVIHDDLIPIFHTQKKYNFLSRNSTLIFMENREKGPFYDLYELFSTNILMIQDFTTELTCFNEVIVGVSKDTTWYQYGFKIPQGPLNTLHYPNFELEYFKRLFFESPMLRMAERRNSDVTSSDFILYFSRTITRKIVNEAPFIFKLMSYFKRPVKTVSIEHDDIFEIILLVSKASIVIGMHGAHFSLVTFMKSSSFVIELFPYAIPSIHYTPYKVLCQLKNIHYIAWENKVENNTVTHVDWPSYLGGIGNLTLDVQSLILKSKTVPKHLCCHDYYWLFRIYQDTIVDLNDFFNEIKMKMTSFTVNKRPIHHIFFPSVVSRVTCRLSKQKLEINYAKPWNFHHMESRSFSYEIMLVETCSNMSNETKMIYESELNTVHILYNTSCSYKAAVACIYNNNKGKFSQYKTCS